MSFKQTVFVCLGENESVRGIFSTEEKAQAFVEHRIRTTRYKTWDIELHVIDEKEVK